MADKKISELTAASALDGTETLPVVQGGTTKKATASQFRDLGGILMIDQGATAVTHTGDTAEFTLKTIAIPANTLGANGQLEIRALLAKSGTAGNWVVRIKFGGTSFHSLTVSASNIGYEVRIRISNQNATNAQIAAPLLIGGFGSSTTAKLTGAIDTTAAQNVVITVQNGNSGDTTSLESWQIIAYPKA